MSTISISDLQYISRETLASTFTPPSSSTDTTTSSPPSSTPTTQAPHRALPANTAIIDVRDSDHIGGHICGSTWIPSSTLDYKMPELLRTLREKDTVVFHCALSQQRGPSAALRYLRERERVAGGGGGGGVESKGEVREEGVGGGKEDEEGKEEGKKQRVYVLQGGFTMWQEKYGEDEELTEGYKKDVWAFGE